MPCHACPENHTCSRKELRISILSINILTSFLNHILNPIYTLFCINRGKNRVKNRVKNMVKKKVKNMIKNVVKKMIKNRVMNRVKNTVKNRLK